MRYKLLLLLVCCLASLPVLAAEEHRCMSTGMFFDDNQPDSRKLMFEEHDKWLPKAGDFELVNYYLMSNVCGARWALVTVKNTSVGASTLKAKHIVALMANGEKRRGVVEKRLKGHETESFTIDYGISPFPIIRILVKNK